jgi:serine/threonine protein kinase
MIIFTPVPYDPKLAGTWALGCILFIMLTGKMPFGMSNVPEMLQNQISRRLIFPYPSELYIKPSAEMLMR